MELGKICESFFDGFAKDLVIQDKEKIFLKIFLKITDEVYLEINVYINISII